MVASPHRTPVEPSMSDERLSDSDLDEVAGVVAGRLMMMIHLVEVRNGWIGEAGMRHDHDRLTGYGYDLSLCPCPLPKPEVSVHLWNPNGAQNRS